ncbi:MAG: hypothetical protein CM15mP39_09590 [Synechococcus sp.]|nr:MAG: hypothetical protein CM15mP39_09590 [Synechococcus sp.]
MFRQLLLGSPENVTRFFNKVVSRPQPVQRLRSPCRSRHLNHPESHGEQTGVTRGLTRLAVWGTTLLSSWMLALLVLQVLFGRQLEQSQTLQLGRDLALNVRLTELTLERYPPALISELTGLELLVSQRPSGPPRESEAMAQRAGNCSKCFARASRTVLNCERPPAGQALRRSGSSCFLRWNRSGCAPPANGAILATAADAAAAGPGGCCRDDGSSLSPT